MIVEMRTYKLKPRMRSQFLETFRSKSIPKHVEMGNKMRTRSDNLAGNHCILIKCVDRAQAVIAVGDDQLAGVFVPAQQEGR